AEDGIRDRNVTGVQTCALPISAAMCRAYNRWLADYCKSYPERLFGVAMLPMQSVELAVDEMRHAREKLGMRGGFLRPNPYHGKRSEERRVGKDGRSRAWTAQ